MTSQRLVGVVRHGDLVGRLGGDEFVVILDRDDDKADGYLPQRLASVVAEPIGELGLQVSASVGTAFAGVGDSPDVVLGRADMAMYAAKGSGGNAVQAFETHHETARRERVGLMNELRTAIARGLIDAHAQPLVRLDDDSVVGYELLARWTRSDGQQVPPLVFVAAAEQLGIDLGQGYHYARPQPLDAMVPAVGAAKR